MSPLAPVLIAFASGIFLSYRLRLGYDALWLALGVSFLPLAISISRKWRFDYLAAAPPFLFIGALFAVPLSHPAHPPEHMKNLVASEGSPEISKLGFDVEGTVLYEPEFYNERTRLYIEAKRVHAGDDSREASGTVLLTMLGRPAIELDRGDSVRFLSPLREPWRYGNPGEFDYKEWLNNRGIYVTGFLKNPGLLVKTSEGKPGLWKTIELFRGRIRAGIDGAGPGNPGLLKALIISEPAGIPKDVKDAFIKTGTWHVVSISGLHIGIVALFSYTVFSFILRRSERLTLAINARKAAMVLSLAPVVIYGLLAGMPVPTQRSVVMAVVFVLAYAAGRGKDFHNALALSALAILALAPYSLWDASFQLTFAALFAIVYLEPRLRAFIPIPDPEQMKKSGRLALFFYKKALPVLLATLSASIGTSPILAWHFHQVSLTGLFANGAVLPISSVIVPLLVVYAVTTQLWPGLASVFLFMADKSLDIVIHVVNAFAALPYSSVWAGTPDMAGIIVFYVLVLSLVNFRVDKRYRYAAFVLPAAYLALYGFSHYYPDDGRLRVTFVSIGQGDSILAQFPDNRTMLVDGGGQYNSDFDTGEKVLAPLLWKKGISRIDYLVLSHAQLDHIGGLAFIAENFDIGEFWWNGDGSLGRLGEILNKKGVPVKVVDGSSMVVKAGGACVTALGPSKSFAGSENDKSLVIKIGYGEKSFLLTGDIEEAGEAELLKRDITADVLKAPHHGSRGSSTIEFLKKVRPSYVVVSAGLHNSFGFPHEETLQRYGSVGASVLRTDLDGAVSIATDGKNMDISAGLTRGAP